jgi:hypothetical protein
VESRAAAPAISGVGTTSVTTATSSVDGERKPLPVPVTTLARRLLPPGQTVKVLQRLDGSVKLSVDGVVTHRFMDEAANGLSTIYGLAADGSTPRFGDVTISAAPR